MGDRRSSLLSRFEDALLTHSVAERRHFTVTLYTERNGACLRYATTLIAPPLLETSNAFQKICAIELIQKSLKSKSIDLLRFLKL